MEYLLSLFIWIVCRYQLHKRTRERDGVWDGRHACLNGVQISDIGCDGKA